MSEGDPGTPETPASSAPGPESSPGEPGRGPRKAGPAEAGPAGNHGHGSGHGHHGALLPLALGALGVVYGDIGTSPLYALRECFLGEHPIEITPDNVLGVLSLIFWALTVVISIKYLAFVMRADNEGEGGILALLSLIKAGEADRAGPRPRFLLLLAGLFGAALLYGDGVLTPSISVLSAVEGLGVATTRFDRFIVPITLVILVSLFSVQYRGTAGIGAIFGPMMLVWFGILAALGLSQLLSEHGDHVSVLQAVDPRRALGFLGHHGWHGFLVLGSVVLVITGGEALYADMGHFGARPIRLAWMTVVFPALLLNYFGQGVLLIEHGKELRHPFFEMAPAWGLVPLVVLATFATIIASQALISGAFSLTQQAVQLGYVPRFTIVHTSDTELGQIYVPAVNKALMVLCIVVVLMFRESSRLADAYGLAVTATMAVTTFLFYAFLRERWNWSRIAAGALCGVFLVFDLAFLGPNLLKITHGGWFPLAIAGIIFTVMTTWKRGRAELSRVLAKGRLPLGLFLADLERRDVHRVPGTAVFMTSNPDGIPPVLLHQFKHNKVLHRRVVLLSVATVRQPEIPREDRVEISDLGQGFYRVLARYGFMQTPNVLEILELCHPRGLSVDPDDATFFLGRETLLPTGESGLPGWRKSLFAVLSRNAPSATAYYGLPPNRVIELGAQLEI
jgi:KUP system potassium uptake protein